MWIMHTSLLYNSTSMSRLTDSDAVSIVPYYLGVSIQEGFFFVSKIGLCHYLTVLSAANSHDLEAPLYGASWNLHTDGCHGVSARVQLCDA